MDAASASDHESQSQVGSIVFGAEISIDQKPVLNMLCNAIRGKVPSLNSTYDRKLFKHCIVVANVAKNILGDTERANTVEALVVGATTKSLDKMTIRKVYTGKRGMAEKLAQANAEILDKSVVSLKDVPDGIIWTIFGDLYDKDWPVEVQTSMSKRSNRPLRREQCA